jgi:hypothetical protein
MTAKDRNMQESEDIKTMGDPKLTSTFRDIQDALEPKPDTTGELARRLYGMGRKP